MAFFAQLLNLIGQLPLLFACLILACLSLPQFVGDSNKEIGILCGIFCSFSFVSYFLQRFNHFRQLGMSFWSLDLLKRIKLNKIDLAVFLLFFSACLSTLTSYFFRESLSGLIKYAFYFFLYIGFCLLIRDRKVVFALLAASFIGLIWADLEGIKQVLFGAEQLATWEDPNIHASNQLSRIYSTFLNPNLCASYMLALWPLSFVGFYFLGKSFLAKSISQSESLKIRNSLIGLSLLILGLITVYLILQTGSRGAWIALFVQLGLIIAFILTFFKPSFALISSLALPLVGGAFYLISKPNFMNRILSIFSSYDHSSNSFRLHVWQASFRIIRDNPIFGIGPGSKVFYLIYGIYMDAGYSALGAYSVFIEIAAEMGFIGLLLLLFLIFSLASEGIKVLSNFKSQFQSYKLIFENPDLLIIAGVLISLAGLLVSSFFDIVILRPQVQIALWLLIAVLRFYSLEKEKKD